MPFGGTSEKACVVFFQGMFDTSLDVGNHDRLRLLPIAQQCGFEQCLMLTRSDLSAKHHGYHLIAKIAVVGCGMRRKQHVGSAS